MAQKDLHNNIKCFNAFNIQAITIDGNHTGNIINTSGYEATEIIIQSGTITDGVYAPAIYESDDSGFATSSLVPAERLIGTTNVVEPLPSYGSATNPIVDATFTIGDSNKVARIGVLNKKRYIRLQITAAATTSGGYFGSTAVLGYPLHAPTPKDK